MVCRSGDEEWGGGSEGWRGLAVRKTRKKSGDSNSGDLSAR